jgi:hypothetical protein
MLRIKAVLLATVLTSSFAGLSGCSGPTDTASDGQTGKVEMPLVATAPSGTQYRLRNAIFVVTRADESTAAVLDSESDPTATLLSANLAPGPYTVTLADGWFLQDVASGITVAADLVGGSTRSVNISLGTAPLLRFTFQVANEKIQTGGSLQIAVNVCGEDTLEPNDTADTATPLPFGVSVMAAICPSNDFFQFAGTSSAQTDFVQIDFTHASGDLDIFLTLPNGNSLISQGVTNQERIEYDASISGTYTLRIIGFAGATNTYTLQRGFVSTP